MRVLVLGSGGREHALCVALARDPAVRRITCAPGNAGTATVADTRTVDVSDPAAVAALAGDLDADLVVVGPEGPLVAGVADELRRHGRAVFGPSAAAARIEGSKAFAKDLMAAAGVPTAESAACDTLADVEKALDRWGAPYVVKDDALAAGKGVVVTGDRAAALDHARACLDRDGGRVVVEEFLAGPEVSLFAVTDGTTVVPLEPAQDFKRVGDNDTGPNTGGMGAYTPLGWLPDGFVAEVRRTVLQPTVDALRERGTPFAGLLYAGLVVTAAGPKVIEFNCRFGDPETQAVLARLETPLAGLLHAAATGTLAAHPPLRWRDEAAVTVVLAAAGYPDKPATGQAIDGLAAAGALPGVTVLHAGTRLEDGITKSDGGRVLAVTALGADLAAARAAAYRALAEIHLPGAHFRRDIALRAERGEITVPLG